MSNRTKRIIKNTGFLYIRMLITMVVALYTSRVLLDTLGAEDFGLYHVVAGFVVLAGFLQGSLSGTTQRFIAFELGKDDTSQLKNVFSMSVNIHVLFALIVLVVGGLFGTWFLPTVLTFDSGRETAIIVVFWFALLSFLINIAVVPYHAMVIAHEQMKVFAWVSIADAFLKLGIIFLIQVLPYDALIAYGILVFLATLVVSSVYVIYVYAKYPNERYRIGWDKTLFRELVSFSGWTIWGNAASVFANQGTNILLNVFFGPIANAAKSIGNQASGALNQFVTNLQMAINPQIIKSYSANDHAYTNKLINYGSKYNFFLMFIFALPIIIRADDILDIWLVDPPRYAALFLQLILLNIVLESVSRPLITAAQATGKIKLYQFIVGGILLLNVPVSYLVLKEGHPPSSVFIVAIGLTFLAAVARVFMLKRIYTFSFSAFAKISLMRVTFVSIVASGLVLFFNQYFADQMNLVTLGIYVLVCFILTTLTIWTIGFEQHERNRLMTIIGLNGRWLRIFK